jgi:uncharacterized membrane protein
MLNRLKFLINRIRERLWVRPLAMCILSVGAFIFSIVALTALKNGYYDKAGRFTLFALTIIVFAIGIVMFVKWVDSIARLGRLGTIITKVERATAVSLQRRRKSPTLSGIPAGPHHHELYL